MNLFVEKFICN